MTNQFLVAVVGAGERATSSGGAVMQMLNGMLVSRCVTLAAELGIADQLREGPRSTAALATATGSEPAALYRVLRTLAGVGVFAERPDGEFQNTPDRGLRARRRLRSRRDRSVRGGGRGASPARRTGQ